MEACGYSDPEKGSKVRAPRFSSLQSPPEGHGKHSPARRDCSDGSPGGSRAAPHAHAAASQCPCFRQAPFTCASVQGALRPERPFCPGVSPSPSAFSGIWAGEKSHSFLSPEPVVETGPAPDLCKQRQSLSCPAGLRWLTCPTVLGAPSWQVCPQRGTVWPQSPRR